MAKDSKADIEELTLTLEGKLMESGSLDYKTLLNVIDGTVGAIDGIARTIDSKGVVTFKIRPPKEKCFEIAIQAIDVLGMTATLMPQVSSIKDLIRLFIEYLKIKKALQGSELKKENIQVNNNGDVIIKDNNEKVIYVDKSKILNINILGDLSKDSGVNKKIDKAISAIEADEGVDKMSYLSSTGELFPIEKGEVEYYKYRERLEERPDNLVGYIRRIDNKTANGAITVIEDEKERSINFEIVIKDIELLDKVVKNLALAEANDARVSLVGERVEDEKGKLKKILVNDIDFVDQKFDF